MSIEIGGSAPIKFRKAIDPKEQDEKLRNVAKIYEEQFMREMVKAMRGTVQDSGLVQVSQGEKLYREQMDHHNVEKWASSGGLGLQKIIYQQLIEKSGAKLGIKAAIEKPQGPSKLSERSVLNDQLHNPQQLNKPHEMVSPWDGKVLKSYEFNPNEYALEIEHDNGLKSRMSFRGTLDKSISQGAIVKAGEPVGLLSPEAKSFFWNVNQSPTETTSFE